MKKRLISLIMAVVMMLSLCTVAFAAETTGVTPELPTDKDGNPTSVAVSAPAGITSITVNGDTAVYHDDEPNADSTIYIRAIDNGGSEYALRHATVEIRKTESTTVSGTGINLIGSGTLLTATDVDLFNKAYTLTINETPYILAAGLPEGAVAIDADDPLRMSSIIVNDTAGTISASNVQNPYIGNATASKGEWTYINYKADIATTTIADRSAVSARYVLPNGTAAVTKTDTNNSCLKTDGKFDLSTPAPSLTVSKTVDGTVLSRDYRIFATDSESFTVQFGIDFTEAMASTYCTGNVVAKVNQIKSQAIQFFGATKGHAYGTITVSSGETVMDIMRKFAVKYGYTSEVPEGCTYMATLNGIGEFDFGPMSGWMYTDDPSWDNNGAALYTTWNTPPVGAADYTLTAGDEICWFICCDYTHHPWN